MNQPAEIQPIKPHLYIITGACMILALWVWWLIEHFTGFRIGRFVPAGAGFGVEIGPPVAVLGEARFAILFPVAEHF